MNYAPKILSRYIIKEFSLTLLVIFGVFLSLFLITGIVEEIVFLKENLSKSLFLKSFYFTFLKIPSNIINFLPFIFLFSGIFFFVKLIRINEIAPIKLSGLSDYYLVSVTGLYAFVIGLVVVAILSPISSELSKHYETKRQSYNNSENLIVFSSTGLWIKESSMKYKYILVKAEKINNNDLANLNNVTIYSLDQDWNLIERIDSKSTKINNYNWNLNNSKIINNEQKRIFINNYNYVSSINIQDVKSYFSNVDTYSVWNISSELDKLNLRGYSPQDFVIKFHKFISLPFLLLAMIILSTVLTINLINKYNNFTYIFYGVCAGILVHYLSALSISIGKAGKLPLIFSVWIPIFIIITISTYNLIKKNEKA